MAGTSTDSTWRPPDWFTKLCRLPWRIRKFIWGTFIFNLALTVFVAWLFTHENDLKGMHVEWFFQHSALILLIFIAWFSITLISGAFSLVPVGLPSKQQEQEREYEIEQRYLNRMIRDTEMLTLRGIPAGLISESVRLDEAFIPMELRYNRPKTDYPLTDKELEYYRQKVKSGVFPKELDRVVIEAEKDWQHMPKDVDHIFEVEKNWLYMHKDSDRKSIANLWTGLTRDHPAAVIQGYPGMGKSTLMERLTLNMARQMLGRDDSDMPELEYFQPPLVPILLRLGRYAIERIKNPNLTLSNYMKLILNELNIPNVTTFIDKSLSDGSSLIMFDGLDEVSDSKMRETVQEAIKLFIQEHRDTSEKKYNRFLITSRVAGYDQAAFPDFPHYLIAELTSKQINYFLPRWSRASVSHVRGMKIDDENELKEAIANEVEWKMKELKVAINDNQGIHELAENPLLLTLLAVMQQNSIELPRQRVELYSVVTRTLLENRNIAKNLEPIPEAKVIQRLGPLAYKMQKEGNSFIRQRDVMESLVESISSSDGGTLNDIEEEAQRFLKRIRERAGLFVQRTGDYFGFMHRTFQEYFAARYLLNQIKLEREKWISKLVEQARSKDALWREPFLLAVAYQSRDNEQIAGEIVYTLLGNPQGILSKDDERYLLLAAESLIETIPYTIDIALDRRVVKQLLQTYEIALDSRDFETCDQIEGIIQRWLKAIPRESYRPPILIVLSEIISDSSQSVLQRATLMLLNVIAQKLQSCSSVVLDMLISPLLALAGLPSVGKYQPTPDLPVSSYSDMVDFALNTLFLLGKRGPYGLLLDDVREQFNDHPEYLRKLADLSLKSGKIMTPFPPPLAEVNYQLYTSAIGRWIALNESMINQIALRISVPDIDTSLSIHLALLNCAEEVYYAITIPLLDILKAVDEHPERPWQQTLQTYLSNQLFAGRFNNYQEIVLLWAILFPHEQEQKKLANILLEHFNGSDISVQLCAQHLLASLSRSLEHSWNLRDLRYITFILNSAYWRYSPNIEELRYLQDSARQSVSNNQKLLFKILDSQQPHHLNKLLFTKEISMRAIERLSFANSASSNLAEYVDLLCILMGRVIQIAKQDEIGQAIEVEIQQIAHIAITCFTHTNIEVVSQTILDIICCLPARSVNEIKFILQLAEGTTNEQMQHACAKALLKNRPKTPEANATLELIKQSKVEVLSTELQNYFEEI